MRAAFSVTNVQSHGTYADGSRWVVPAAGAQITAVTPTATTWTGTLGSTSFVDAAIHGMMANPGRADNPTGTLLELQNANCRFAGSADTNDGQGWDARRVSPNMRYGAARNVDPAVTGSPISLVAGNAYVKAVSDTGTPDNRETVLTFGVLTVLATAPAHTDACRPSMALPDKTSRWRTSDIVLPEQQSVAGVSDGFQFNYTHFAERLAFAETHIDTDNTNSRNVTPAFGDGYAGTSAEHLGDAAMWLIVGGGTLAERTEIARMICQKAEDVRGRVLQGGVWARNGGWSHYAHQIVLVANQLLPGMFDDALATTVQDPTGQNLGGSGSGGSIVPFGAAALGEFTRVELITQTLVDNAPNQSAPYRADQIGWPEWCSQFGEAMA